MVWVSRGAGRLRGDGVRQWWEEQLRLEALVM